MAKSWYVYILTNFTNNVFYTGVTNNLERRILEHKTKVNSKSFSAKYKLYKLLWFEEFNNPLEAITNEKKVKDFRREKKINLVKEKNPLFKDLFTTLC